MSDLDLKERVRQLMKLPQELCKMCGKCCQVAIYKGGLTYEEVIRISQSTEEDESQVNGARDFLSIFVPYSSEEEARKINSESVDRIYEKFGKNSKISFFHCKFLSEQNNCLNYDNRPLLCRLYPTPHERTFFFPGCGFEEQGKKNWQEIIEIMDSLEQKKNAIKQQRENIKQMEESLMKKMQETNE